MITKHALIEKLYQINAIQFGNFTLKSGKDSPIYIDLRQIISYPEILRSVAEIMWQKVQTLNVDLICGVPYTALPIATTISLLHHIPMVMRRKEKKAYGTRKSIEGKFLPNQSCLIIEDVITTGSSILETAEDLAAENLKITDVIVLIDREQGGRENMEKNHFQLHSVLTMKEAMQYLFETNIISSSEKTIIAGLI